MQEPQLFSPSPADMRHAPSLSALDAVATPFRTPSRLCVFTRGAAEGAGVPLSSGHIINFRLRSVQ